MDRLRVLTWHVHGSYLEALGRTGLELLLPTLPGGPTGYGGRAALDLSDRVRDVPAEGVRELAFDAILFQSRRNYLEDQWRILSPAQRRLPRVYLEHDPPREHPTDTCHPVDDPEVTVVHVTHFNALMWDDGRSPVRVIEHAVPDPEVDWRGDRERGISVFNDLASRGRRAGRDLFLAARDEVPLDLLGLRSEELGGLGSLPRTALPAFLAPYRFFFHPARYTSLGLSVIEAMRMGMPVVAPATTEIVTVLEDGRSGITATDPARLRAGMRTLLADRELAARLGAAGREVAERRFGMQRFIRDWEGLFAELVEEHARAAHDEEATASRRTSDRARRAA